MGQQPKSTTHFNISHPSLGPPKTPRAERQAWHSSTANGANKGLHRHQCRLLLVPLAIRWGGCASTWSPRYDWNKEAQRILLPWISISHVRYWQDVNLWRAHGHYNKSLRNSTPDILSQDLIAHKPSFAGKSMQFGPLSSVSQSCQSCHCRQTISIENLAGSAEANGKFDACANPNPLSEEDLRKQPGSQEGQQWKKTANVSWSV